VHASSASASDSHHRVDRDELLRHTQPRTHTRPLHTYIIANSMLLAIIAMRVHTYIATLMYNVYASSALDGSLQRLKGTSFSVTHSRAHPPTHYTHI